MWRKNKNQVLPSAKFWEKLPSKCEKICKILTKIGMTSILINFSHIYFTKFWENLPIKCEKNLQNFNQNWIDIDFN